MLIPAQIKTAWEKFFLQRALFIPKQLISNEKYDFTGEANPLNGPYLFRVVQL